MNELKYIVICGPDLKDHDPKVLLLLNESIKQLGDCQAVSILPETKLGAVGIRKLVRDTIADSSITSAVFVTRYEHTVSEFANAVADGTISREDLLIKLVRYTYDNKPTFLVSEHRMSEDRQFLNDDWPMGILW